MAYTRKTLSGNVGVGATVPTLFTYRTEDTRATVEGADYFNGSADIFIANDLIMAQTGDGLAIYIVVSNDGSTVVVAVAETEA